MSKAAAALIIENIAAIEEAVKLIEHEICKNLFSAVDKVIERWAVDLKWKGVFDFWGEKSTTYFTSPQWGSDNSLDEWTAKFELDAINPDDEKYWLTYALGAHAGRTGFRFSIDRRHLSGATRQRPWRAFTLQENQAFPEIEKAGFQFEPSDGTWFLPWTIDAKSLAENYVNDAIQNSLDPIREALKTIEITYPIFEKIVVAAQQQFSMDLASEGVEA
ncbi:MAG: hypothetical protein JSR69_23840 [Proteobacteria bacterium]|nr:hypothetical protein [Pseudomonadota bacterium]